MVATDIREQRLRIQPRRAAGGREPGTVDEPRTTQLLRNGDERSLDPKAELAADVARGAAATRARPSSLRIVRACVRYAASVRYQRVTLDDLSSAAHVSERRVRDAFSDCLGVSPTAFLRVAALLEVRQTLLDAPAMRDAVTRAASDFGFWHLGRFAGQYRALFGEAPSTTLARARAGRRQATDVMSSTASSDDVSPHPTPATSARAGVAGGPMP